MPFQDAQLRVQCHFYRVGHGGIFLILREVDAKLMELRQRCEIRSQAFDKAYLSFGFRQIGAVNTIDEGIEIEAQLD